MNIAEVRILGGMSGKTKKARYKNEHIWDHLGVSLISDKLRSTTLRWFWHVQFRTTMVLVKKKFSMKIDGPSKKKGVSRREYEW